MTRSLSLLAVFALAAAAPAYAAPHPMRTDLETAKANPASVFNHAGANIQSSDTGGHIATVVDKVRFSDATGYGEKAQVQVEVTDPFGYYKAGGKVAPEAIRANVASSQVWGGHDYNYAIAQGTNVTLAKVAEGIYRGKVLVSAATRQGNDMNISLGDVKVSFAGKDSTWNSRFGQNYTAPVTTSTESFATP